MHPKTFRLSLLLFFSGIIGAICIWLATRSGIGISHDSAYFLDGAIHIDNQGSFSSEVDGDNEPLIKYPPIYSFFLALFSQFGINIISAARILNSLFFALNIYLSGYIFYRITGGNISWSIIFSLTILISWPMMEVHAWAWMEPIYLFLINLGILMLAEFFQKGKINYLIIALICIGLAPITKYSGLTLIPVACLAIFFFTPVSVNRKATLSVLFGVLATLPVTFWMYRNYHVAGTVSNREVSFSVISVNNLGSIIETVSSWLLYKEVGSTLRITLFLLFLLFIVMLFLFNLRQQKIHLLYFRSKQNLFLTRIFSIFMSLYFLYISIYISLFNPETSIDSRSLSPLYIPFLIGLFHTLFLWQKFSYSNKFYRTFISIIGITFLLNSILQWTGIMNSISK